MIDPEKRGAIVLLHKEGMSIRDISDTLNVSRNTVSAIIEHKGIMPDRKRADKIQIDTELLRRLYNECEGRVKRVHEKLTEEEGIVIAYSTLTKITRELDLRGRQKKRCAHVPDEPGREMQHDTSVYRLSIGDKKVRVVGSLLYLRYCKMRYLKFYRSFNRFTMKCFFHEALSFLGYAALVCIIDNTNLARLRGTGTDAIMVPEMEKFAKQYGFTFMCHRIGHCNRKAGNERSFYTVETNFFPGRTFKSLEDLNRQAYEWATVRMPNRPVAKSRLLPAKAFEYEKSYLVKLPSCVPPPYLIHKRGIDQYGYTSFDGNFYWVPGNSREEVMVLQYSDTLKIYQRRKLLGEYELPPCGVKNEVISPKGMPKPQYKPKYRKKPTAEEEKKLRAMAEEINAYLDFALTLKGSKEKHRFIRQLFVLSKKIVNPLFIKTMKRALTYRITDIKTVERIALLQIKDSDYEIPYIEINDQFQNREAYVEGCLTDEADLSIYEELLEKDENDG
jgi:transposase